MLASLHMGLISNTGAGVGMPNVEGCFGRRKEEERKQRQCERQLTCMQPMGNILLFSWLVSETQQKTGSAAHCD